MARSLVIPSRRAVVALVATALMTSALVLAQTQAQAQVKTVEATTVEEKSKPETKGTEAPAAGKAVTSATTTTAVIKAAAKKAQVAQKAAGFPVAPADPNADANLEAFTQQSLQQYRPFLRAELRLLTSATELDAAQRRAIAIEGSRTVRDIARKMAENQLGLNRGVRQVVVNQQANREPRLAIHDSVAASAKKILSAEQYARFQKEIDARIQDHRQATVTNVVANLDKILYLSPEQRTKLVESMISQWDDKIYPSLEILVMYEGYFPLIPDKQVTPHLNAAQKQTWQSAQKINFSGMNFAAFFNNGMMNNGNEENNLLEDPDEKAGYALVKEEKRK